MFDGRWRHAVDRTTKPVGSRSGACRDHRRRPHHLRSGHVRGHGVRGGIGPPRRWAILLLFPTGPARPLRRAGGQGVGTASVRGAFFDSVADRISDAFLFGGVAWYLAAHHHGEMVLLPFAILAVTSLISYQRAKAELLGLSAKGGLMERAERFILLGLCFIAHGALGAGAVGVLRPHQPPPPSGASSAVWQAAEGPRVGGGPPPAHPGRARARAASIALAPTARRHYAPMRPRAGRRAGRTLAGPPTGGPGQPHRTAPRHARRTRLAGRSVNGHDNRSEQLTADPSSPQ